MSIENQTLLRCPRCWESVLTSHRKWVGLTPEEIDKAIEDNQRFGGFRKVGFAYDLEVLLKEKNI
jgi:uncharacterized protein YlaN (UPF0358 family)